MGMTASLDDRAADPRGRKPAAPKPEKAAPRAHQAELNLPPPSAAAAQAAAARARMLTPKAPPPRRARGKLERLIEARPPLKPILLSLFLVGATLTFLGPRLGPLGGKFQQGVTDIAVATTAGFGLRVKDILVDGRRQASASVIAAALDARPGDAILGFDATAARARIEADPWIASATVELRLPDTIFVRIVERQPLALWQHDGRFVVIDAKGTVILDPAPPEFAKLPVVVGDQAPTNAEALLAMLDTEPALKARVAASINISGRRWNLRFDNGVDVRLPEDEPDGAWAKLAQLDKSHALLDRDIKTIDLRFPDRLIARLAGPSAERLRQATAKQKS